jgi:hypothetical protein
LNPREKFTKTSEEVANKQLFKNLIKSLIFLTTTRLDITFITSRLSQFLHKATKTHFIIEKRVMCYIKGTLDYGLNYKHNTNTKLTSYSDNDWGGSEDF